MSRRPGRAQAIWEAYNDTGTLPIECTNCGAQPGTWCTRPDGRVRRTPCLARITAVAPVKGRIPDAPTAVDFSEPRHPNTEGTQPA